MKVIRKNSLDSQPNPVQTARPEVAGVTESDRLGEPWTEADSLRAQIIRTRKDNDILVEDYGFYQKCLEETLQEPTELWSFLPKKQNTEKSARVYHFIRRYEHEDPFWYVVFAKDATDASQIEIVDAFPTTDESLVQQCRYGKKENLDGTDSVDQTLIPETGRRNVH
jgi:hypothetical protein